MCPGGRRASSVAFRRTRPPAVAVDAQFFYAIDDAAIGNNQKDTGQGASKWEETPGGPVTHLNSGIVQDGLLYCAQLELPRHTDGELRRSVRDSSDDARSQHPIAAGIWFGNLVDRADGQWWVTFAQYAGKGGEAGKGPKDTVIVSSTIGGRSRHRGRSRSVSS